MVSPRLALAVVVCAAYFAVARVAGNLYPFSTFSMYSRRALGHPSRLLARDARGAVHEIAAFDRFRCPPLPPLEQTRCDGRSDVETIEYLDRDADAYVRAHRADAPGGEPVDLVRRVWIFPEGDGAPRTEDCLVARCSVELR